MTERAASSPRGAGSLADALARVPRELRSSRAGCAGGARSGTAGRRSCPWTPIPDAWPRARDPATWATFEEAVAVVGRWRCDGRGVRLRAGPRLHGARPRPRDFGWRPRPRVPLVVEEAGTYTEVSPSGDGLHLIFRGAKPDWASARARASRRARGGDVRPRPLLHRDGGRLRGSRLPRLEPRRGGEGVPHLDRAGAGRRAPTLSAAATRGPDASWTTRPCWGACTPPAAATRSAPHGRRLLGAGRRSLGGGHGAVLAPRVLVRRRRRPHGPDLPALRPHARQVGQPPGRHHLRRADDRAGDRGLLGVLPAEERRADRPSRPVRPSRASDKNMCSTAALDTDGGGSSDEEAPDFESAPSVEGWFDDARGRLWVRGRDGELSRSVTSTAPWVAADLVDVDTGDVRALVRVTVPGGVRERALDREVLLNQSKVIGALAPLGANVSSANAKDVVRYLTDVERRYGWARPRARSVVHLGWADGPASPPSCPTTWARAACASTPPRTRR